MKIRVLTLRFDPRLGRFDDTPMQQFLADKDFLEAKDHFFFHEGLPFLAVVLSYHPGPSPASLPSVKKAPRQQEPWRDLLEPSQMPLFNTLREWRGQKSRDAGVPPYVICTNREIAEVVRLRPQNLAGLGEVHGFGKAKLQRYGSEILAFLRTPSEATAESPPSPEVREEQEVREEPAAEESQADGG